MRTNRQAFTLTLPRVSDDVSTLALRLQRRMRAIRETGAVRRAIHGATHQDAGAAGSVAVLSALDRGVVRELLLTTRFIETQPAIALQASEAAVATHATVTIVTGVPAFQLDLLAGGIGAVTRWRPPTVA